VSEEGPKRLSRRRFLTIAGGAGAAALATQIPFARATPGPLRITGYPFSLGVTAGDPTPDGAVLWTRLAPSPLSGDGGMPDVTVPVKWEVSKNDTFSQVAAAGEELAVLGDAHSVHAEPAGLQPGTEYFYRFIAAGEASPTGRFKTAPAAGTSPSNLVFCFASCQQYEHGYYTAYRHMANEGQLDLIVHVGDYIYEYGTNLYTSTGGNPRGHSNREIVSLADYRERHAQYKTDPDLQAAHAAAAWLVTFDDHEIDNNWAGEVPEEGMPHDAFLKRRASAFRAYWEHMPMRKAARPTSSGIQVYRRAQYGNLATFHVLDTRQFRSDQACGDGSRSGCDARLDPTRSLTGSAQEAWLLDGLDTSPATWQVLANQVFMAQQDTTTGVGESFNMDAWDGYKANRDRLLSFIDQKGGLNPIVVTGDVHANWAADLLADFSNPQSKILGSEFVGTSISTTGDGADTGNAARLTENPWIKFNQQQRGYVRMTLSGSECRGDFRVVPYVKRPGAPISTRKSYVVQAGHPGLQDA
jgi:alkaline phosphatase D